MINIMYVNV